MVASSVVSTILILNYHHRNADTHEMSGWVSGIKMEFPSQTFEWILNQKYSALFRIRAGAVSVFILAAMYTENESTTQSPIYGNRLSADSMLKQFGATK